MLVIRIRPTEILLVSCRQMTADMEVGPLSPSGSLLPNIGAHSTLANATNLLLAVSACISSSCSHAWNGL